MASGEQVCSPRLFRVQTVRGEPYHVGGRTLTPVVRFVTFGKARATVGAWRIGGWGGGLARLTPVAIVEQTAQGEQRIPITDTTSAAVQGLLTATLAVTLFCTAARWLIGRKRRAAA